MTRKRIKRINLRVREPDGSIAVSAPYFVADREIINFIRSKRSWIDRTSARVRERSQTSGKPATDAEKKVMRADLRKRIAKRLPEIEQITGLRCSGWTVRDMHTRWGSCNTTTHHINLSLMLADRSDTELDYVILHELVHTVVPNHGKDFYALMDHFMPGWKQVRRSLKY